MNDQSLTAASALAANVSVEPRDWSLRIRDTAMVAPGFRRTHADPQACWHPIEHIRPRASAWERRESSRLPQLSN